LSPDEEGAMHDNTRDVVDDRGCDQPEDCVGEPTAADRRFPSIPLGGFCLYPLFPVELLQNKPF
jgi:hypothetical protein